jgi:AcrR family transcriptional regulator
MGMGSSSVRAKRVAGRPVKAGKPAAAKKSAAAGMVAATKKHALAKKHATRTEHGCEATVRASRVDADGDARTRLLEAALELFGSKGFAATGVRDLAAAAGVNVAAVNYHFGSKDELRMEALRHGFAPTLGVGEKMRAQLARAQEAGTMAAFEEALRQCIDLFLRELVGTNSKHWAMFLREQMSTGPALEMVVREFFRPVGEVLAQLVDRLISGISEMQRHRVISSMIGQCLHVRNGAPVSRYFTGVDPLTPEQLKAASEHIAAFSLHAIRGMRAAMNATHAKKARR